MMRSNHTVNKDRKQEERKKEKKKQQHCKYCVIKAAALRFQIFRRQILLFMFAQLLLRQDWQEIIGNKWKMI